MVEYALIYGLAANTRWRMGRSLSIRASFSVLRSVTIPRVYYDLSAMTPEYSYLLKRRFLFRQCSQSLVQRIHDDLPHGRVPCGVLVHALASQEVDERRFRLVVREESSRRDDDRLPRDWSSWRTSREGTRLTRRRKCGKSIVRPSLQVIRRTRTRPSRRRGTRESAWSSI